MNELVYEPGPTGDYGSSGIPRAGMEEHYATALWRDGPSAFWLHPEGPLSDKTPKQYFKPRPDPAPVYTHDRWGNAYSNGLGSLLQNYTTQAQLANQQAASQQYQAARLGAFGNLFGGLI